MAQMLRAIHCQLPFHCFNHTQYLTLNLLLDTAA